MLLVWYSSKMQLLLRDFLHRSELWKSRVEWEGCRVTGNEVGQFVLVLFAALNGACSTLFGLCHPLSHSDVVSVDCVWYLWGPLLLRLRVNF